MGMRTFLAIAGLTLAPTLALAEGTGSMGGQDVNPGQEQRTSMPGQMNQQSHQQIFNSSDNFDIEGTVASVDMSDNKLTINRKNLPPAELKTANQTSVKVDGRQASLSDLRPGTEIRAKFNLNEDEAIATEVSASSPHGSNPSKAR